MRFTLVVLVAGLLCSGCASKGKQSESQFQDKTVSVKTAEKTKAKESPGKKAQQSKAEILLSNEVSGKVMLVNDGLRYVVIDFGFGRLPQPEQRLSVYRSGKKVGEVKISGNPKASNFAADVVTGNVHVGDEVKQ